ncbi:MAG: thioredoxin-disulfide reductase [Deltaproteobacteria bacterium]|nr:MAG: thioredoxin-disulfide reductase [Deltaproteobacteria bacterium]
MTENIYDTIIIGGGPGGLSAGIYAKRAAMNTALIEKGVPGGQIVNSDEVENYLGYEHIGGAELSMKFSQHAQAYDLDIISQEVSEIIPGANVHTVKLANGDAFKACSIIMAMGGNPRKLAIPGEDTNYGKGVSYCAVCDGFFFRDKTVMVIGGGDTAAEEALYLAKLAKKVYMAHRRDALRAGMILQQRIFSECKIDMLWNTIPTEIKAGAEGVNSIALQDTVSGNKRELAVDGAFIFIGFVPNNQLVPAGIKMTADGYVVTDAKCETNIPGIFAIGDLMEKYARQIITAAADGCTAALAAAHYVEAKKASDECQLE